MYEMRKIEYDTNDYAQTLALRNEVMRKPLGRSIYDEDLSSEKDAYVVGIFNQDKLVAMGVADQNKRGVYQIHYVCVDTSQHKSGFGRQIVEALESYLEEEGAQEVSLSARMTAFDFYKKLGYQETGEVFLMDIAPVEHIKMMKKLA